MSRWFAWLNTGSHESLLDAATFLEIFQRRQGPMVCCPEEIAHSKGWIMAKDMEKLARSLIKNGWGQYLMQMISQKQLKPIALENQPIRKYSVLIKIDFLPL